MNTKSTSVFFLAALKLQQVARPRNFHLLIALSSALSSMPVVAATIEVSNLGNSSDFTGSSSSGFPIPTIVYAGKFTTDAQGYFLEAAKASLNNSLTPSDGLATFEARLYSDAGAVPGSLLVTFDNLPTLAIGSALTTVDFTTSAAFALNASTSYWLAIRNTTGNYFGWALTSDDAQTSPGAWSIDNSAIATSNNTGTNWSDQSGIYSSYVPKFAILASSVPEPTRAILLLGGLGALLLRRRRTHVNGVLTLQSPVEFFM